MRSIPWWLWLIVALAFAMRMAPVLYGLPYELDPDERSFVTAAWRIVETGTYDSDWYGHPAAPYIALLAGLYSIYGQIGILIGAFDSMADVGAAYRADVTDFFVIGRVVSAVIGTAVVVAIYALARELRTRPAWAGVAALMAAVSWPLIRFSSMVRADMWLCLFLLLIVLLMVRARGRPQARFFVAAGALLGLAVTSKYPGLLGVVPIVYTNIALTIDRSITPRQGWMWLLAAALTSLGVAFVVAPYLFLNLDGLIYWLSVETRSEHLGATGIGPLDNLVRYLVEALPSGLGVPGAMVGLIGLTAMLARRRERPLALTFWAYLAFLSFLSLWWPRWALPLLTLALVAVGWILAQGDTWLGRREFRAAWRSVGRAVAAALLVVPIALPAIDAVRTYATNDDLRVRVNEWVLEHAPPGSTLLVDSYSTQVSTEDYEVLISWWGELLPWTEFNDKARPDGYFGSLGTSWSPSGPEEMLDAIAREGVDYVFMTDLWIDILDPEFEGHALPLRIYDTLQAQFPVVARFEPEPGELGSPVTVLEVPSGAD